MDMKTLRALKESGQTLFAKNCTKTTITANDENGRFELGPEGSEDAVKPIPQSKLDMPGVLSLVRLGKLVIGTDEIFSEDLDRQGKMSEEKATETKGLDATIVEDPSKRDLIVKKCLLTGKDVLQTSEEVKAGVPPLDASVAHRAHEFVLRHEQTEDGHRAVWDHVKIGS